MTVILVATFEDVSVRVITSLAVAIERALDLARLGWDVEIHDESGRPIDLSDEDGTVVTIPDSEPVPDGGHIAADVSSSPPGVDPSPLSRAG